MSNLKDTIYVFRFPFLDNILLTGGIDSIRVRTLCSDIQQWLDQNVSRNGMRNYEWVHGLPYAVTNGYADYICFAYETDLLAFRLRWGFHG